MTIGSLIDMALAPLAPGWALKRSVARSKLALMATYAGAEKGRLDQDVLARAKMKSADAAILPDRETLIARARLLSRDTPHGRSLRRTFVRRVVGCGVSPVPIVRDREGNMLKEWNKKARRAFMRWASNPKLCDMEKTRTFWAIQRQAIGEMVEVGSHFVVLSARKPSFAQTSPIRLTLQAFEPEQLDVNMRNDQATNDIRAGIEIDEFGAPIRYFFLSQHPYDYAETLQVAYRRYAVPVPAERVCHVFEPERVRQTHGVTRYAPVIRKIKDIGLFDEANLMAARMEACIGLIMRRDPLSTGVGDVAGLNNPSGTTGLDVDGNREVNFQPGMVYDAGTDTVEPFTPTRSSGAYAPFLNTQLRSVAAGVGAGFGSFTMDFTQGTYSGQRQEENEVRTEYDILQDVLVPSLCEPVYRAFISEAILRGILERPDVEDDDAIFDAEWQGPPRPWFDPRNDAEANALLIKLGLRSRKRILNELGDAVDDTFDQLAEEQEMAEERDIDISGNTASQPAQSATDQNTAPGDKGKPGDEAKPGGGADDKETTEANRMAVHLNGTH